MAKKVPCWPFLGQDFFISYNVFSDLFIHLLYGTGGASFSFDADTSRVVARHNFGFFRVSCVW